MLHHSQYSVIMGENSEQEMKNQYLHESLLCLSQTPLSLGAEQLYGGAVHAVSEYIMTSCINCAAMFPPNLILDFSVTRLFQREAQTPVLVVATLPSLSTAPALQPHTGPGC